MMIISDLDGTLLQGDHELGAYTQEVMQALAAQGHTLVMATGRHFIEAKRFCEQANFPAYLITSNGARIHDPQLNLISAQNLEPSAVTGICNYLLAPEQLATMNIYTDAGWHYNQLDPLLADFKNDFPQYPFSVEACPTQGVSKIFLCEKDLTLIARYQRELTEQFGTQLHLTTSYPWCLEMMAAGVSKGGAIRLLAEQLAIPLAQTIAFGDGLNDVEMLSTVAEGMLMGNADQRLKEALPSNLVIGDHKEEAVAHYLAARFL